MEMLYLGKYYLFYIWVFQSICIVFKYYSEYLTPTLIYTLLFSSVMP